MTDLFQLLERIKARPAMYLGKPSLTRLKAFLDGYIGARNDLGFPLPEQEEILNNFQIWIQAKFKISSSHSFADIILFYCQDEREALTKFFDLWENFRSQPLNNDEVLIKENSQVLMS